MSGDIAFVGDVHGNLNALRGLWDALVARGEQHTVFLGDYINKGPQSAEVLRELIQYSHNGRATLLKGNHEVALLEAIESGDLTVFLKMGGAMTIRSYTGPRVGANVAEEFRTAVPEEHLEAMRRMSDTYETEVVIAQHLPPTHTSKFRISAHTPVGIRPRIGPSSAELDTGCGSGGGRLTALLWPSRDYLQVDADGALVTT